MQGVLCKDSTFGSSLRGESHLEGSESQFCSEYRPSCARQDERFYINYCCNATFVESLISPPVYL